MKKLITYGFFTYALLGMTTQVLGYPENVRHGYTSCKTCHFSPTGGGTLTEYGRRLSEEVQSTWANENEANFLHNAVGMPGYLSVGGDIRSVYYKREAKTYKESRMFLMQADVEVVSPKWLGWLTAAANGGYYDEDGRLRRAYLLADVNESFSVRGGLFAPAFGIKTPEHEIATKRPLGFNEGSEVPALEVSYTSELFEVFLTGFSGEKGEQQSRDSGTTLKAGFNLGKRSQVGFSVYSGSSKIHDRLIVGPYAMIGFSDALYLLAEIDYQKREISSKEDSLIENEEGVFAYNKFGWEVLKGLHTFVVYETARPMASESETFFDGYGLGVTWFPRPHYELQALYEKTDDPGTSSSSGDLLMAMLHYYL